ncbi:UNVERIFIED_CONTAM: hypothetical protein RMT77_014911 [Armadillidium vulgare]
MNFLLIIVHCCIFLSVLAWNSLWKCHPPHHAYASYLTFFFRIICTKNSCNWKNDFSCNEGTFSEVLQWETDIFEIGFEPLKDKRPKEIVIKINLNGDYYIQIEVISDRPTETVTIKLKECSHTKNCLGNLTKTHKVNFREDFTFVGIGFRKDKKINFVAVSKNRDLATNLFGPENEYEFKTPGFHFNTSETMNITVSSPLDEDYNFNGLIMYLPASVGGYFFNDEGYLRHGEDDVCDSFYNNPNETEGLTYIVKEYFQNSENWKAPTVIYTLFARGTYYDEDGMKFNSEQMKIKEAKNLNFDETKMIRKGCKYVEKPYEYTTSELPETTTRLTEPETTETTTTTTTTTLTEDKVEITEKFLHTPMPPVPRMETLFEGEITINNVILIPKTDPSEPDINLTELIDRVGDKFFKDDYVNNVRKGLNDFNVQLFNGTPVDVKNRKFKNEKKKEGLGKKKKTKQIGSGGAGDASRGQKQAKILSGKYIVILILMILSLRRLWK